MYRFQGKIFRTFQNLDLFCSFLTPQDVICFFFLNSGNFELRTRGFGGVGQLDRYLMPELLLTHIWYLFGYQKVPSISSWQQRQIFKL